MSEQSPAKNRDIDVLRSRLEGEVHVRGEEGYQSSIDGFNTLSPVAPDLVVVAAGEEDVQQAVRFALTHDLPVAVQATGHGSYRRVDRGVLIRTHLMNAVSVDADAGTFTVQAGVRWADILPRLAEHGLAAVTGSSPTVSAVGLVLGGGLGPFSRTLGWAADRAVSFRVVDGSGDLLEVSADESPDLFRALKGGKVGLGVVTSMTARAVPLREVYGGGLFFAQEHIADVHRAWLDWAVALPEAANTSIAILRMPPEGVPEPLAGRTLAHVRYAYVDPGLDAAALIEAGEFLLAPLRAVAPIHLDAVGPMPAADVGAIHADPPGPLPVWEYGEFLDEVDRDYVDTVLRHAGADADAPFAMVETRIMGGAIPRDADAPNAIGGRRAHFALLVVAAVPPGQWDAISAKGDALFADVAPYLHAEVNYNWAGHPAGRFDRVWSPETSRFLAAVRQKHDPRGLFDVGVKADA